MGGADGDDDELEPIELSGEERWMLETLESTTDEFAADRSFSLPLARSLPTASMAAQRTRPEP